MNYPYQGHRCKNFAYKELFIDRTMYNLRKFDFKIESNIFPIGFSHFVVLLHIVN